ncbi:hypothetical protein [Rickettsia asembonensis]|uniref:Uncharacterized protein n=1 Tax=Rickettsia asembonensis TaxID=1068590 RepID=A0A0C2RD84_9RICK|nr:hypothetical protein [Rickettsia asembonensis]KIJ88770.1 hypothetical protein SB78_03590 [Rickettsia asembonensis]
MATKPLATSTKIANLAKVKQQRIQKIEAELNVQLTSLLIKRKEEIFNIFNRFSAVDIDDKLLIGFLKFITHKDNKDHPIIKEFLTLANKTRLLKRKGNN